MRNDIFLKKIISRISFFKIFFLVSLIGLPLFSQCQDSLASKKQTPFTEKKHSPRRAGIESAILPGFGQIYNKKYWKVPIIYAGGITVGYFIHRNYNKYSAYRNAYILRNDADSTTTDIYTGIYTSENLFDLQEYYRRYLDLSVILAAGLYALNILDAVVDAHLFYFNVGDDLSLRTTPFIYSDLSHKPVKGISISLNF